MNTLDKTYTAVKLQDLKEWIASVPAEFLEYPVVFGESINIDAESCYRRDSAIELLYIDDAVDCKRAVLGVDLTPPGAIPSLVEATTELINKTLELLEPTVYTKTPVQLRFPNETEYNELKCFDFADFVEDTVFENEISGMYKGSFIIIKK